MCNELIEKLKWAQTEKLNVLIGFTQLNEK